MVDRRQSDMLQNRILKHVKQPITLCAFVCLFGVSALAVAQGPAQQEPVQNETPHQDSRQLGYLLLGTACALGLCMGGVWLLIRRRRRDQTLLGFEDFETFGASDERGFSPTQRTVKASGPHHESALAATNPSAETVLDPLDGLHSVQPQRSTDARAPGNNHRRSNKPGQHPLDRMACTGCERRYKAGVDFCYHDGLPLMQDTRESALNAPTFKACESCGWEGEADDQKLCPNDACSDESNALTDIDPSDSTHVQPTIPMTMCPTCRDFGMPGTAFCPKDGDVFMPVLNMRSTEFPARGFGPRRKVCGACGADHGGHAFYCSNDGTRLVALN
jgi:hypothetical protein